MQKVNNRDVPETSWLSPKGRYVTFDREISVALGRERNSTDLNVRHPFDVEICRLPPGKAACPFHSHSAQWEFFHVLAGAGQVRDNAGLHSIEPGDSFLFKPGEAHQIINNTPSDLLIMIIADNPIGETCYYPDSKKWMVSSPERRVLRSDPLDYFDGEE